MDRQLRWTWDPDKNYANLRIHGLTFEVAMLVFDDLLAASQEDMYAPEHRWRTMGMVGEVVVIVIHTWPEYDPDTRAEVGRIISARKATSQERKFYEEEYF